MYESWTRKSSNFSVNLTYSKKCKIARETGYRALGTALRYKCGMQSLQNSWKLGKYFSKMEYSQKIEIF